MYKITRAPQSYIIHHIKSHISCGDCQDNMYLLSIFHTCIEGNHVLGIQVSGISIGQFLGANDEEKSH